ncbi:hypothetical protein D6D21_07009 [Aureobasidium pullulans]|uniref:F-box domain-containing protein n=1 Tax=Aureobasidium pullulans TaxID=5580 RepID=A0AB74IUA9_AURPU|nr:hypothetical protein D6D21_07009 [Aureobasidium pullulans]
MPTAILLPPEIWDLVAATTNSNDLANSRLTNKTIYNAATRPFGLARLTNRRFIISPFSLKGLVELTAHPVLGRCLKSVSVSTYRISMKYRGCPEGSDDKQYDAAHHASATQSRFEKADLHIQLLIEALTNLKAHGVRVVLGLFDDVVEDRFPRSGDPPRRDGRLDGRLVRHVHCRAYGFGELYVDLDLSMVGSRQPNLTLEAIGIAMHSSGCNGDVASTSGQITGPLGSYAHASDQLRRKALLGSSRVTWSLARFIMVFRSDRSMLLVNHPIVTIGMASGSNPNIYLSPHGDFTNILHSGSEKIVLRRALRCLELLDVHIFGHDGTAEGGIVDFWTALRDTLKLEILVLGGLTFEYAARSLRIVGVVTLRGPEIDARFKDPIAVTGVWMRDSTAHAGTLMLE